MFTLWRKKRDKVLLKTLRHNICVVIQEMFELEIEAKFIKNDDN